MEMIGEEKRLVTFALFAYNQEAYIRDAVEGALSQTYEPLEIIISDDCSRDQTFNIIQDAVAGYDGPHKLILNSNKSNLGLIAHVNKVAAMSSGSLIIVASGDDISHTFRAAMLADMFYGLGEKPLLIHSSVEMISPEGKHWGVKAPPITSNVRSNQIDRAAAMDRVYIGASGAWNKKLFETFGPIAYPAAYEDIVLGARAAMMGGLVYCPAPLLKYRVDTGISANGRFKDIESFFAWRRDWLTSMEDAYRQRIEDSKKVDFLDRALILKKLDFFSAMRRMYAGRSSLLAELGSRPVQSARLIVSESLSIVSILLYTVWTLWKRVRTCTP